MFLGKGFRIGRISGVEIRLDWSWFIIFGLLIFLWGMNILSIRENTALQQSVPLLQKLTAVPPVWFWVTTVLTALLFFTSVLVHEMSHAVVARRNGIPVNSITLFIFGGVAQMEDEPPTAWAEFKMAIAGPIASIGMAALFGVMVPVSAYFGSALMFVAFFILSLVNVMLVIFNMIPGYPLDGGRVFRAILWGSTKNLLKATRIASVVGQAFGWIFIVFGIAGIFYPLLQQYGGSPWMALIGWFLVSAAKSSYQQLIMRETLSHVSVRDLMNPQVEAVSPHITVDHLVTEYFLRESASALAVEEQGQLLGVVTIDDVRALPRDRWETTLVGDIVHSAEEGQVLHLDNDAWDAANRMIQSNQEQMLVTEQGHVEGVVTRGAIARWLQTHPMAARGMA